MDSTEKRIIKYTLIYVTKEENVLLGFKKRGLGKNLYNGFGGKIESNENALEGAIRELEEESGLTVAQTEMKYVGLVIYEHKIWTAIVYIFTTTISKVGLEIETDEMKPKWFNLNEIPYDLMSSDKREWVPSVLRGKGIHATFYYDEEDKLSRRYIDILDTLPNINEIYKHSFAFLMYGDDIL